LFEGDEPAMKDYLEKRNDPSSLKAAQLLPEGKFFDDEGSDRVHEFFFRICWATVNPLKTSPPRPK
jgi:hypothetical protein